MDNNKSGDVYRVFGAIGSPYAAKIRAILRYRQLPFTWIPASQIWSPTYSVVHKEIEHIKPAVIPIMWAPQDNSYHIDSTEQAYRLEEFHSERSIVPTHSGHAFLSHLLEDMADEWGVKIAFQYRWSNPDDGKFTSKMIMGEVLGYDTPEEIVDAAAKEFRERQVERMKLVGCSGLNTALIEKTYQRVLDAVNLMPGESPFLFGTRPSLGDFGWFGALFTCFRDPTPAAIMREHSHACCRWIQVMDEASGVDGEWHSETGNELPAATRELIKLACEVYLPFLNANAQALENGEKTFEVEILGHTHQQGTFPYQAKCFRRLSQMFKSLTGQERSDAEDILKEFGGLEYLTNGPLK